MVDFLCQVKIDKKFDFKQFSNLFRFYYFLGTNSTPICGASMTKCYHDAEDELLNNNIRNHLSKISSDCNCLPVCTSIKYGTEISQSDLDFKSLFEAYGTDLDGFKE